MLLYLCTLLCGSVEFASVETFMQLTFMQLYLWFVQYSATLGELSGNLSCTNRGYVAGSRSGASPLASQIQCMVSMGRRGTVFEVLGFQSRRVGQSWH